jgi:hypothetical protein
LTTYKRLLASFILIFITPAITHAVTTIYDDTLRTAYTDAHQWNNGLKPENISHSIPPGTAHDSANDKDRLFDYKYQFGLIKQDHLNYYTYSNLFKFLAGVAVAAPFANTGADADIRKWIQNDLRSSTSDNIADVTRNFGEVYFAIPAFVGGIALGKLFDDYPGGSLLMNWGMRSLRSVIVGTPPLFVCQGILGGSRPSAHNGSDWRPFQANNSCSGHTFLGAIPFITAAQLSDNWLAKTAWYLGSFATGFSRLNDDKHYFSQILLGWWMAYIAASSVDQTEHNRQKFDIAPLIVPGDQSALGLSVLVHF